MAMVTLTYNNNYMKKQTRIPRPIGLTEKALYINNNKEAVNGKEELQQHIINHYINTGFQYCNQPMSIEEFSHYTQIDPSLITKGIIEYGQTTMHLVDPEQSGDVLRALVGIVLNESLADRSRALQQYSILASSQGNAYKPFISSEVTRALKLTQEATTNMMNLYRMIAGNEGPKILINNNLNSQTNNYLTPESALEIIAQKDNTAPLLENDKAREELYQQYSIADMPEVEANKQQGIDLTREGANFNKLAKISDALVNKLDEVPNKEKHRDRRARELNIDLKADQI